MKVLLPVIRHVVWKRTAGSPVIYVLLLFCMSFGSALLGQMFPNPATLSTGQGTVGSNDPLWLCSPWSSTVPGNPMLETYSPTLINNNCAPGSWVTPSTLPAPMNNGNWITGTESNCATNTVSGYRYFRLTLNLPPDCNGFSVTTAGNYVLDLLGYVDNVIVDVFINGTAQGISGGSYAAGSPLNIHLIGPWAIGTNYVDVLVHNVPSASPGVNPYGLLMVADANSAAGNDTDNDGVNDLDDLCPCEAGTNPYGCNDPVVNTCDVQAIRNAFIAAGCIELYNCVSDCSMYFLNPVSNTGSGAQAFAQTLGANLISIQSAAENQCILEELVRLNQVGVIWIGFNDEAVEGRFEWYDQSPVTYTNWAPGEPNQSGNEDCVQIYPGGIYPGTWNDLSCTSANAKSIIEVNLCPVINAGADVSICIGSSTNLTPTNTLFGSFPYTYSWSNNVNTQQQTVSPTVTTSYIVTTVDRYQCSTKDTVVVTVNNLPPVSAGNDVVVCPEETVTLIGSGAVSYAWNNGITNGTAFTPGTSSETYIVTGTDANGCRNTDTVEVSVMLEGCPNFPNDHHCDIQAIRTAFSDAGCIEMVGCISECSMYFLNPQSMTGSQAQAFAQTLGANLVSVQSQQENDCILSSLLSLGLNTTNDVIWIGFNDEAVEGTFVWYDQSPVVYTNWAAGEPNNSGGDEDCVQIYPDGHWNDLNCARANAKSIIEVNLCPVINAGQDKIICLHETVDIECTETILGSNPYSYTWSNGASTTRTSVSPSQTTEYVVTTKDRYNCTSKDSLVVTVNPLPQADFTAQAVCDGEPTIFTNLSSTPGTPGINSSWNFGNGNSSTNPAPQINYDHAGSYSVKLVVTNTEGCSDSITKTVIVYGIPAQPEIISNSPLECPDDELHMSIKTVSGASYFWLGPNNYTSEQQAVSFPVNFSNTGTYKAYITINGCVSDTSSILVQILGSLVPYTEDFPNVITPNGDGINDYLDIDQFFNSCLPYDLKLYNRWGSLVYEQSLGTTPFNGKDKGGAALSPGTYFYQLRYGDELKTGFINIIRE